MKTLVCILITLLSTSAFATTYEFVGATYPAALPPFTTAMRIEGSFTVADPLPVNMPMTNIGPGAAIPLVTSWTFTDGVTTYDETNSSLFGGSTNGHFMASTDAAGNVLDYSITLINPRLPHTVGGLVNVIWIATERADNPFLRMIASHQLPCLALNQDAEMACGAIGLSQVFYTVDGGTNRKLIGTWAIAEPGESESSATPVPTMSAYGLFLTMLGLLLVAQRRLLASAKR